MNELTDYLEAVTALDGLPGWYSSEQARLRADEQQAKLKAEADAGRRRDEITAHRGLVESSLNDARTSLRDVALGQLIPAVVKPEAGKPAKGADDLARDIKEAASDIRRFSHKLKAHRQEAHERRLAEEAAVLERERQRQLEEAERCARERAAALASAERWLEQRKRATTIAGVLGAIVFFVLSIVGLLIGQIPLAALGAVLGVGAFAGLRVTLGPKGPVPVLPDEGPA